jgi:hypothetical protein
MIKKILFQLILAAFPLIQIYGQSDLNDTCRVSADNQNKSFLLFGSDEILTISISFDLTDFMHKAKRENSFDGIMTIHQAENDSIEREITVKYRGTFRFENCSFPSMQINFKKPVHAYCDSDKIKKLKMVSRCGTAKIYDEYGLREYLVYKLFNAITDTSYRVRLLSITFIDTKNRKKPVTQYGFFIEPLDILAARINADIVKSTNLTQVNIVPEVMDRVAIFNYMIANWDWSVPGLHNISVLKSRTIVDSGLGLSVPYDFDISGLVNADYSIPAEATGLKNARDRKYTGICRSKEVFESDLKNFLAKKAKLYSVVNDFPYLSEKSKKDIITFLNQFFIQIEKQKNLNPIINEFMNNCKRL